MSQLQCVVVTPEQTVYSSDASYVTVTLYDGELGILPGHAPLIGRLGFGELRVTRIDAQQKDRYYIEGGFVEVADNVVSILTGYAVPGENIKVDEAENTIAAGSSTVGSTEYDRSATNLTLQKAKAKLRVARNCEKTGH